MANKNKNKKKEYRVINKDNYYVIEFSLNGGKKWNFADSSTSLEEANKKMENLKNGLTASGLTQEDANEISWLKDTPTNDNSDQNSKTASTKEEAKTSIPEDTPTNDNSDQNKKTAPTKEEDKKPVVKQITTPTAYELEHPNFTEKNKDYPKDEKDASTAESIFEKYPIELTEKQLKEMFDINPYELPSQDEKDNPKFSNAIGYRTPFGFIKIDPNKITDNEKLIDKIKNDYRYGLGNEFLRYNDGSYVINDYNLLSWISNNPKDKDLRKTVRKIINTRKILGEKPNTQSPKKKNPYWNNLLYGNDIGSAQNNKDAQAEKEKKMDDFIKNNPNMIKAIFGKNSGLNFGERVARLGEMLAMIGADATRGAYAGFNHQALPDATKGRYSEIYNKALNKQYERKQDVFKSENKAIIDKANRISIITSSPILKNLPPDILDLLADRTVVGLSEEEWDNVKNKLEKNNYRENEINEIKRTYNALRNTYSEITTQRGNVVELNGKEFDLMRKPQQVINELEAQKRTLKEKLLEIDSMPFEKLKDFMADFKSIYSGIQSVSDSMSENKDFGYNVSAEVKSGIPVISGVVSGGIDGKKGSEKSTDTKIDKLALEGLAAGKTTADEWNSATKNSKNALKASIQAAIDEIDEQIKTLKEYQKLHSIDDGIVKAPHMKQWIVREDGTRIELNPNDNIYATKNKLTTKKDNNSKNIIPMEKEDNVIIIQKKLGYDGNKRIIKQSDYYLTKLRK